MAETIGSLIDKISILDLKIYHMQEQIDRVDASSAHKKTSRSKVEILKVQKSDLTEELSDLFEAVIKGKKRLKIYRQFKMYNDPIYKISSRLNG